MADQHRPIGALCTTARHLKVPAKPEIMIWVKEI
jgi:hypothetical protein